MGPRRIRPKRSNARAALRFQRLAMIYLLCYGRVKRP